MATMVSWVLNDIRRCPAPAHPALWHHSIQHRGYFRAEIKTVLEKLFAAWSELDPAKAAPFYAKDADLTFFDIAPLKYNGWSEYTEGVPKAFAAYRSGKFTLNDDLRTHRHGNLAWASATWRAELTKKDGSKENPEGRYTAVLEKRGQQWLLIHEHMSLPAPPH